MAAAAGTAGIAGTAGAAGIAGAAGTAGIAGTAGTAGIAGTGQAGGAAGAADVGPTAPGAPGTPTVVGGAHQVTVAWTAPASDGGAAITGYIVTPYMASAPQAPISVGNVLTYVVTGLTDGTIYTFTVMATNANGTGAASGLSSPVTPATTPDAPGAPQVTSGDTQIALTWTAPTSDGGAAIAGYVITPFIGNDPQTAIPAGNVLTYTVTGLVNGTTYTFTVAAVNARGMGATSLPSSSATPGTTPDAPGAPSAIPGNAQAALAWTAPANDGGAAIASYVVTLYAGGTAQMSIPVGNALTTTVTGLTDGATYTFTVTAVNANGSGAASLPSSPVTPGTTPDAPAAPAAIAGDGEVSLTWSAPPTDGGAAITAYQVTPYIAGVAQAGFDTATNVTSAAVTGLSNGTAYTFTVAAINSWGLGPASAPSTAATPATQPSAPGTPVATPADSGSVSLTWGAPGSDGGAAIIGYVITPYAGTIAQTAISTGSASTTFTVSGLNDGIAYTFTVAATNRLGTGAASAASNSVTPGTVPGEPPAPAATPGNASAALSWSAPSDTGGLPITSYRIVPYLGTSAQTAITTGSAGTTWTVSGLTNGAAYTFTVAATNALGTGAASAASTAVTPTGPPSAPQLVKATAGDGAVALTWQAPSSSGGSAVTGYVVTPYAAGVAQTAINLGNVTSDSVTGLVNGTRYQFAVAATSSAGTGPTSSSNPVTPSSGTACLGTPIFSDLPLLSPHSSATADAVGDFNGDGLADLAVANSGTGDISILLGNGDGTFGAAQNYPVASSLRSVLAVDLDGDGLSDLVVTAATSTVYVMINNGDGTFPAPASYTPAGTSAPYVAAGDFNADGHLDLAAGSGTQLSIFLGTGTGSFGSPTSYSGSVTIGSLTVSTFNADTAADVAVAGGSTIGVWLGNGNGTFKGQKTSSVGGTAGPLAAGDFNKDGRMDVAVTTNGNDIIYTLAGNGDGTFGAALTNYDNSPTRYLSAADFNGDGYADLVVTNSGNTSILVGRSTAFTSGLDWLGDIDNAGGLPPALGDFNRDGTPDIVVGSSVFLGKGDGTFLLPTSYAGAEVYGVFATDLNGDGKPDLVATDYTNGQVDVYLGPSIGASTAYAVGTSPMAIAAATFNADSIPDLVVANSGSANVTVLYGTGGGFWAARNFAAGSTPTAVTTGDFNGDTFQDIAVANDTSAGGVSVLAGDGTGNFAAATSYAAGIRTMGIASADFDGDSKRDLVAANYGSSNVSVMLGAGDGTFPTAANYSVGQGPYAVAAGNLGNGQLDLVTANYTAGTVSVLLGNGDGTFQTATAYPVANNPTGIAIGDVNGDTKPDLVVSNSSAVSVLLGNGDGTFQTALRYLSTGPYDTLNYGRTARSVALGDFNNDGHVDIGIGTINGSFFGSTLTILPYSGCD